MIEIGIFRPAMTPVEAALGGRGRLHRYRPQNVHDCQVGDTMTPGERADHGSRCPATDPSKPMVFAGFYPVNGEEYPELRDALDN